jgi:hypothetical protein
MRGVCTLGLMLTGSLLAVNAGAQQVAGSAWLGKTSRVLQQPRSQYVSLGEAAQSVPLESVGLLALVTYTGFKDWKWGSASFRFNSEGWFGMSTGSGGLDKLGHAYGSYMASALPIASAR